MSIDTYITVWLTVILALIESILIGWFYGMCDSEMHTFCIGSNKKVYSLESAAFFLAHLRPELQNNKEVNNLKTISRAKLILFVPSLFQAETTSLR